MLSCLLMISSEGTPKLNVFFQEWGFLGVLVASIMGLFQASKWFIGSKHRDLDSAVLSLEQAASATFVSIILKEARRVFALVDDHLPQALSQEDETIWEESRFDRFCGGLRAIPEEELGSRGRYTAVIREVFSKIISEVASRLLGAMDSHGVSPGNQALNPTGIRYSLENDGYQSFSEVSRFDSKNRGMELLFRRVWLATGVVTIVAAVCCIGAIVPVLIDHATAERVAWWSIWSGVGAAATGALLFSWSMFVKYRIIARSSRYGRPQAVAELVQKRVEGK